MFVMIRQLYVRNDTSIIRVVMIRQLYVMIRQYVRNDTSIIRS